MAEIIRDHDLPPPPSPIGEPVARVDAVAKVTGEAQYAVDHSAASQLYGLVVRSTRAHARLVSVEGAAALEVPGCVAVISGSDVAERLFPRFGHIVPDHPILALDKVRYYGEPVALVLAEDPYAAVDAAELVEVVYEDLTAPMDTDQALAEGAPILHETRYDRSGSALGADHDLPGDARNVAHATSRGWGDPDAAMDEAEFVIENTVHYPMLYAYAMEPYNALATYADGHLDVVTTAQHPFMVQRDLARIVDLPLSRVRVRSPYVGGGYGSKSYTKVEPLATVGAVLTGRPVKVSLDVEGAMYTTRADGAHITVKSGFSADGTLLARTFDIVLDTGAYADNSPLVLDKAVNRCFGPYRIPHLRVTGRAVYTATTPASSYRGFGAFQGNLAGETNIDIAAERLGIDPVELRARNLVSRGETFIPGRRPMDAKLVDDLTILRDRVGTLAPEVAHDGRIRVSGIGCSASDAGAVPTSTAQVRMLTDGSVLLLTGSTEMGQGSRTVLGQIAAAELRVPFERVTVRQSDTQSTPFERTTGASRTTTLAGLAVQRACADLLERLQEMASEVMGVPTEDLTPAEGGFEAGSTGQRAAYAQIVTDWFGSGGGEMTGLGVVRRAGELADLPPFWEIGMVGVTLLIDPETGVAEVEKLVTVADVGLAINPQGVHGQDLGAATQGLGGALFEELHYDGPQLLNSNVVEYRVPRITDRPHHIETVIVERRDGVGPFGAKGAGEGALNPIGSAVAGAVARATGRWTEHLPLTPERIWRLLREPGTTTS